MGVGSDLPTQETTTLIRAEVDRLSATVLSGSLRLQSFLRYIVEQSLTGQADRLKEYSIGLEVYGKSSDYDPKIDATVRGEASRLRSKLASYYQTDGRNDQVVITVPKGGYAPAFEIRTACALVAIGDSPTTKERARRLRPLRFVAACSAVAVILCLGFIAGWRQSSERASEISSLAILPFRALAPEPSVSDEALGLAFAEALITRLGSSKDILVRPLSSVRDVTQDVADPVAAGRKLRVSAVIDGSFQRSGERIRLTARLIRTKDGRHLWSGEFDEKSDDAFALQEMLTERVARALMLEVVSASRRRAPAPEVFDLCTRGRYHIFRYTAEDAVKALNHYTLAASKDANYAPAFAGMSWAYIQHAEFFLMPNAAVREKARDAAERAVQLDDSCVEGHVALGNVQLVSWDWENAERSYKRALALNPRHLEPVYCYRNLLIATGRLDEGMDVSRRIRDLDPLSPRLNLGIVSTLLTMRRYDEAIQAALSTLELAPEFSETHRWLAEIYYRKGIYEEWFKSWTRWSELAQEPAANRATLTKAYKTGGVRAYWRKTLELLEERSRHSPVSAAALAGVYAELGERDRAFECLERAYAEKETNMVHLKTSFTFDALRSDPRYAALLKRMKL